MRSMWIRMGLLCVTLQLAFAPVAPGRCDEATSGVQTIVGGSQLAGSFVFLGLGQQYGTLDGGIATPPPAGVSLTEQDGNYAGIAFPCLLSMGIPLFTSGLITLAGGSKAVVDPANHGLWRRVVTGRLTGLPASLFGGAVSGFALGVTLAQAHAGWSPSFLSLFVPITAYGTWCTGLFTTIDGERALAKLYYEEDITSDRPGDLYKLVSPSQTPCIQSA